MFVPQLTFRPSLFVLCAHSATVTVALAPAETGVVVNVGVIYNCSVAGDAIQLQGTAGQCLLRGNATCSEGSSSNYVRQLECVSRHDANAKQQRDHQVISCSCT